MEFVIRKNATLPLLKMQVVKDGRGTYEDFMSFIETSTIYFSMQNIDNGTVKINTAFAGFVEKTFVEPNATPEYYLYYRFSKRDTNKVGRFEGQFLLRNESGTLVLPIREKLNILIKDSLLDDDLDYNECFVGKYECCIIGPPSFTTPTPTRTPTPTISITPSVTKTQTPTLTVTPSVTKTQTPTLTVTPSVTQTNTPTNTVTPSPTNTVTPSQTNTVTPTTTITPTITLTPSITPSITITSTPTNTPQPTATPISLTTYYGTWSQYLPLGTQQCSATLSALTISTATTLVNGSVVSNLDGTPINSLKIIWSDFEDTYNSNTNSSSVVSTGGGCDSEPIPTVCSSDQFTITNNTGSPITVNNVTSPFTNVSLSQFTLSAFTNLIVCSCTTPTTSGGSVTNNGACPYL